MSKSPLLMTAAELGRLLKLSERHIRRLRREGLFPGTGTEFDAKKCVPAYVAFLKTGSATGSLADERLLFTRAKRIKVETDNEIKRGKIIWAWQVQNIMQTQAADICGRLEGLPGRVAAEFAGMTDASTIRERLLDECRSIREGHARYIEELAESKHDPDDSGQTPSANA